MQCRSPPLWLWLLVPAPAVAGLATMPTMPTMPTTPGCLAHQVPGLERIMAARGAHSEIGLRTQRSRSTELLFANGRRPRPSRPTTPLYLCLWRPRTMAGGL